MATPPQQARSTATEQKIWNSAPVSGSGDGPRLAPIGHEAMRFNTNLDLDASTA